MSEYFIHEGNVREYTKTGHKWLSPLAIVRKLNKLEKENAELKVKLDEVNELLRKCKDTVQASLAEEGISDMRRSYREDLYKLIENELKEQGE